MPPTVPRHRPSTRSALLALVLLASQIVSLGGQRLSASKTATALQAKNQPYAGPVILCAGIPDAHPGERYLVTMAVTNASDPQMIYSTFSSAVEVNVTTAEATVCLPWDGLDENYMPVVPGTYASTGIAMKAATWPVDGKPHAITAEYAAAALPFAPTPAEVSQNVSGYNFHVIGDPVGSAMMAVTVDSDTNTAVFYHGYLGEFYTIVCFDRTMRVFPVVIGEHIALVLTLRLVDT
jgi:hypothetical protein